MEAWYMSKIRCLLRSFGTVLPLACTFVGCLAATSYDRPVWAQAGAGAPAYTWDTIDPAFADPKEVVARRGEKDQVIFGRVGYSDRFDAWYKNYLFPSMATEELLGDIYEKRAMINKDLEQASDSVHQVLLNLIYPEATRRVTENYHPSVRFNAMLIVGDLNQTEAHVVGGARYPAIRLPQAFDFMVDEFKKPDQLDAVRLAAMVGIQRHLFLVRQRPADQPILDARKAEVASLMKALLDEKTPPAGRTADGHAWLRRKAADVLATLGAVGDNHSIFDSLVRIVGDAEEPLSLRCTAAQALGELVYTDVTGIDALATARQLGALAAFACRTEDTRAKDEQKTMEEETSTGARMGGAGGMPGMGMPGVGMPGVGMPGVGMPGIGMPGLGGEDSTGPGGYPGLGGSSGYPGMGSSAKPVNKEMENLITRVRRRLKQPLHCVLVGVSGPQEWTKAAAGNATLGAVAQLAADDQQKAEITKIVNALVAIVKATDKHKNGLPEMLKEVRVKTRELEALLPNVAVATEKPAADEALPGAAAPADAAAPAGKTPPADAGAPAGTGEPAKKAS
jgi:hypothetical protein